MMDGLETSVWDADLSAGEARRLSPRDKGRRSLTSITRKIELLESWAKNGAPKEFVPSIPFGERWSEEDKASHSG